MKRKSSNLVLYSNKYLFTAFRVQEKFLGQISISSDHLLLHVGTNVTISQPSMFISGLTLTLITYKSK